MLHNLTHSILNFPSYQRNAIKLKYGGYEPSKSFWLTNVVIIPLASDLVKAMLQAEMKELIEKNIIQDSVLLLETCCFVSFQFNIMSFKAHIWLKTKIAKFSTIGE